MTKQIASRRKSQTASARSRSTLQGKNHLSIRIPQVTTGSFGDIKLNGKSLNNVLSVRIEIPSEDGPFVKVTAQFMSTLELDTRITSVKQLGRICEFRS